MKVKEIMERSGLKTLGLARAYIADGLEEIAKTIDDNIKEDVQNIVAGTREYPFPDGMVRLRNVYIKNSDGNYQKIPRLSTGPAEVK